jgi:hypothetical protein
MPAAVAAATGPPPWMGNIPGLAPIAPDALPPDAAVALAGCTQTLNLFQDDPGRVRQFVPSRYELGENAYFGPDVATVFSSVLACDEARVGHGSGAKMLLSMVGVQIRSVATPGAEPFQSMWNAYNGSTLNFLPSSSWYLISAETNNTAVAGRLAEAGLEVETLPGLSFETQYFGAHKTDVAVGGELAAQPGTPVADLFGASPRKTSMAFNHPDSHAWGYISLRGLSKGANNAN